MARSHSALLDFQNTPRLLHQELTCFEVMVHLSTSHELGIRVVRMLLSWLLLLFLPDVENAVHGNQFNNRTLTRQDITLLFDIVLFFSCGERVVKMPIFQETSDICLAYAERVVRVCICRSAVLLHSPVQPLAVGFRYIP